VRASTPWPARPAVGASCPSLPRRAPPCYITPEPPSACYAACASRRAHIRRPPFSLRYGEDEGRWGWRADPAPSPRRAGCPRSEDGTWSRLAPIAPSLAKKRGRWSIPRLTAPRTTGWCRPGRVAPPWPGRSMAWRAIARAARATFRGYAACSACAPPHRAGRAGLREPGAASPFLRERGHYDQTIKRGSNGLGSAGWRGTTRTT
jgi:hypothetical protein